MSAPAILIGLSGRIFIFRKVVEMKVLLISRKFWTSMLLLLVVVVSVFIPGFNLDTEQAAGLLVIAVSYIIGVAVDPGPGDWRGVLQSRKFWAAIVGFTVMILDGFGILLPLELTPEQLITIAVTIGALISGVALQKPKLTEAQYKAREKV
jgi:hypothetical protein